MSAVTTLVAPLKASSFLYLADAEMALLGICGLLFL